MLTLRRTAAASALAASYLARADARRHVMIGTGALAPHLIQAHASARPIREVVVWGRDPTKTAALVNRLASWAKASGIAMAATEDREAAVRSADIATSATLSPEPLIRGEWLRRGTHVDLVGAYTPKMREADDDAIRRSRVYVDTRAGATKEAGDIVQPLASGVLNEGDIQGDLFDLCRGTAAGRSRDDEITLFKSVGTALEDLAAAQLTVERV
jgi:ornithine cyclodeaminase